MEFGPGITSTSLFNVLVFALVVFAILAAHMSRRTTFCGVTEARGVAKADCLLTFDELVVAGEELYSIAEK
jgi:hypothetical protein